MRLLSGKATSTPDSVLARAVYLVPVELPRSKVACGMGPACTSGTISDIGVEYTEVLLWLVARAGLLALVLRGLSTTAAFSVSVDKRLFAFRMTKIGSDDCMSAAVGVLYGASMERRRNSLDVRS